MCIIKTEVMYNSSWHELCSTATILLELHVLLGIQLLKARLLPSNSQQIIMKSDQYDVYNFVTP